MKNKFYLLLLLSTFTVSAQVQYITIESLLDKVEVLTSKEFDGRLPGSEGYSNAVKYTADFFSDLGLNSFNNSYFQTLNVEYNKIEAPALFKLIYPFEKDYKLGRDYIFRGFTGSGNFNAPVVFCGYGISDSLYDDYKDLDVNGKVVMVFKSHPKWSFEGRSFSSSLPREKSAVAAGKGAVGILFVSSPNDKEPQGLIGSVLHGSGEQNENFPQLHISLEAANEILSPSAVKLKELQTKIDSLKNPFSLTTGSSIQIIANAEYTKEAAVENLVGYIEGTDPELKNEWIVIGAHLDHVGSQAGEVLFPGANDNASGSAGVMQISEAFVKADIKPLRSVIFVLFASEEQGLNGSKYFVENSPVPQGNIIAMFNLDCIGYGDSIQIGNGKSAPVLWQLIKNIDKENFDLMTENTWSGGGADAQPFHDAGIPAAYVVTKNSYKHLHLPTDTAETLNVKLYERIVRLAFLAAVDIANGKYMREDIIK